MPGAPGRGRPLAAAMLRPQRSGRSVQTKAGSGIGGLLAPDAVATKELAGEPITIQAVATTPGDVTFNTGSAMAILLKR